MVAFDRVARDWFRDLLFVRCKTFEATRFGQRREIIRFLFVLFLFVGRGAHASEPFAFSEAEDHSCEYQLRFDQIISDDVAKENIAAHSAFDNQLRNNNFSTLRNLNSYRGVFGAAFSTAIKRLQYGDTWIDMGAGLAIAQTQLLVERRLRSHLPTLIALSYERPRRLTSSIEYQSASRARYQARHIHYLEKHLVEFADAFQYIEGRKVEDIPIREIAQPGSVKLITDLFGPLSYSPELVKILRTYGELLAPNGQLHIAASDELLKVIEPLTGRALSIFDFIELYCEGFRVIRGSGIPTIIRTGALLKVPPLQLVSFESGSPSILTYSIRE